jgi:hypothetical protein
MKRKEVDDVMGGEGAWDNVDQTATQCPGSDCDGDRAYFYMVQIRSADEPMTTFYKVRAGLRRRRRGGWSRAVAEYTRYALAVTHLRGVSICGM